MVVQALMTAVRLILPLFCAPSPLAAPCRFCSHDFRKRLFSKRRCGLPEKILAPPSKVPGKHHPPTSSKPRDSMLAPTKPRVVQRFVCLRVSSPLLLFLARISKPFVTHILNFLSSHVRPFGILSTLGSLQSRHTLLPGLASRPY